MFEDKTLVCRDCGKEFVFSASEQQFFADKGFQNDPTRCHESVSYTHLTLPTNSRV